jgi:hypothetical protein
MLHNLRVSVDSYVREALGRASAEWEEHPDGVISVLLPGEPELKRVTFEPEVAREEKDVELAAYGSRFLEALAETGARRGRLARAWAPPRPLPPPPLSHAYQFRAENLARTEWSERAWTTWIFAFGLRYAGEFRRDDLYLCAVDAAALRLVRRFEDVLSRLVLSSSGPDPEGDLPFEECYAVARDETFRKAAAGFTAAQRESNEDLGKELARLERYYGGLIEEMNADMERVVAGDPRRTAILARIQATRADRDRAIEQSRERYRMSLEVEAIGALGIVYPRRVTTVALSDKRGNKAEVEAAWDPVFEQYEPFACPACRKPAYSLELRGRSASCGCE